MLTKIDVSKPLTKHISDGCRWKFDGKKCNYFKSGIKICVDVSAKSNKTLCM